ncbi:MAG: metallophosphoesterase family protein [Bacillota bacterium]|jgi:putative phosphoesterase|nr:metallophosphoesterase family protein [Bacillota bacterium]HHT89602.1 metallophosphoesterase family protein [Bacillota bacterium]
MSRVRIGVISDTHGLLRSQAKTILQGCQHIIHAGDLDHPSILTELASIAPTTAVRGNMDVGPWAQDLKTTERLRLDQWSILVVHSISDLPDPLGDTDIVIFGHSHKFSQEKREGRLYLNPGSAGPRRFLLPVSMAVLSLGKEAKVERVLLQSKL